MEEQGVRSLVRFSVTVRSQDRGDHWMTMGLKTGIVTYGPTREEAEHRNGDAHIDAVRLVKRQGVSAIKAFMKDRDIDHTIDEETPNFPQREDLPPFGPVLAPIAGEYPIDPPEDRALKVAA